MKGKPVSREGKIGRIEGLLTSTTNINSCTLSEVVG